MDAVQVDKAVEALMKHCRAQESSSMTDTDSKVFVQVSFKNVPNKTKHPLRLTLKHAMYSHDPSICLITKDPQRYFKDLVKTHGIKVGRVIGVGKFKKKFKEREAKRILCESHDVFLVDERVIPIMPRWFGKYFYKKGKAPVKVDLTKKDLKSEIESATKSYMMSNLGNGNSISIPCGRVSFDNEQLSDNIHSALKELSSQVRPGWKNIKAVYIKSDASVSLPIYTSISTAAFKI